MPDDYSWITPDMFEEKVRDIAYRHGTGELLAIPGVWEIVQEHFNNAVLEELEEEREVTS